MSQTLLWERSVKRSRSVIVVHPRHCLDTNQDFAWQALVRTEARSSTLSVKAFEPVLSAIERPIAASAVEEGTAIIILARIWKVLYSKTLLALCDQY
jgi:hypothetical protein